MLQELNKLQELESKFDVNVCIIHVYLAQFFLTFRQPSLTIPRDKWSIEILYTLLQCKDVMIVMDGNSKDKLQFDEFLLLFPNLKSMFFFNHVKSNNNNTDLLNVTHLERCIEKKKSEKRPWVNRIIHGKRATRKSTRAQGLVEYLDFVIVVMDQIKYIYPWDKLNNALIILFNATLMNWIYNQQILLQYVLNM